MELAGPEPQLVGEDWRPSDVQDAGARELAARIEGAPPLLVPREALEDRCGLEPREVWSLGVRRAPAGLVGAAAGLGLRLAVVLAGVAFALLVLLTLAGVTVVDDGPADEVPLRLAFATTLLLAAVAARRLVTGAGERLREQHLARRRVRAEPVAPLLDPHARLTVAVLDGPGVHRVLLVWMRGAVDAPDLLEVRVLAERRVPRDAPLEAEDAVAALSEVAMLGGRLRTGEDVAAHADALPVPPATTAALALANRGDAPWAPTRTPSRVRVDEDWQPDGTTAEGEAELARRLVRAEPRAWSGELLAPLLVQDVREVGASVSPVPRTTERWRRRPRSAWVTAPAAVAVSFCGMFVLAAPGDAGLAAELTARGLFLALGGWIGWKAFEPRLRELPAALRRRRLMRRVDTAAADVAAALEGALPGGHGRPAVLVGATGEHAVVRLLHLRRIHDAPDGTLEVRVLAERRLDPGAADANVREAVGRFLLVADDQAFTAGRGREHVGALRRLTWRLGLRTPGPRAGRALVREPVAAAAGALIGLSGFFAFGGVVTLVRGVGRPELWAAAVIGAAAGARALVRVARRWTSVPGD